MARTSYENYVLDSSALAAEVAQESKMSCLGCLFWFIVIVIVLAILL